MTPQGDILLLPWVLSLLFTLRPSAADVGTAAYYKPPYLPTACYESDSSQFPANNMFAAAGEGIWDNQASCGREYLVRCLSSVGPTRACLPGEVVIQVRVVDRASKLVSRPSAAAATTMVLSLAAFDAIANRSATTELNIEFKQV